MKKRSFDISDFCIVFDDEMLSVEYKNGYVCSTISKDDFFKKYSISRDNFDACMELRAMDKDSRPSNIPFEVRMCALNIAKAYLTETNNAIMAMESENPFSSPVKIFGKWFLVTKQDIGLIATFPLAFACTIVCALSKVPIAIFASKAFFLAYVACLLLRIGKKILLQKGILRYNCSSELPLLAKLEEEGKKLKED